MTGAVTLTLVMRLLRELVEKHTTITGDIPPDRWAKLQRLSQKSHQRLIELVAQGDAVVAEQFWRQHLDEVGHHLGKAATARVIDLIET